jgi:cytochrome P450
VCAGQHLALLEARIVMALLLLRFELIPRDAACGEKHPSVVPVCPHTGMYVRVE